MAVRQPELRLMLETMKNHLPVIAFASLLAACGGDDNNQTGSDSAGSTPVPAPAPTPAPTPTPTPAVTELMDGASATLDCVRGNNGDRPTIKITYALDRISTVDVDPTGSSFEYQTPKADAQVTTNNVGTTYTWNLTPNGLEKVWVTLDATGQIIGWATHAAERSLYLACGVTRDDVDSILNRNPNPVLLDGVSATLTCVRGNNGSTPTFRVSYARNELTTTDTDPTGSSFVYPTPRGEAVITNTSAGTVYTWQLSPDGLEKTWVTLAANGGIIGWVVHGVEASLYVACGVSRDDADAILNR